MVEELDATLGGIYAMLSVEFQLPLVKRLMAKMTAEKKLPALPKGVVNPSIVTGIEALGRGQDLNKLQMFLQGVSGMGPQAASRIKWGEAISRMATSLRNRYLRSDRH